MHQRGICLPRFACSILDNSRGAVVLLSIYFLSLALLTLSSIALQLSSFDMRSAEFSRDTQQSFYLAEGALDRATTVLRANIEDIQLNHEYSIELNSRNRYTYEFRQVSNTMNPGGTQEIRYEIIATGSVGEASDASRRLTRLRATADVQQTYKGALANGNLYSVASWRGIHANPVTIEGDALSTSGHLEWVEFGHGGFWKMPMELAEGTVVKGNVAVDFPEQENGYKVLMSHTHADKPAIYLEGEDRSGGGLGYRSADIEGEAIQRATAALTAADIPNELSSKCSANGLNIGDDQNVNIHDGDALDISPDANRIVLCVRSVYIGMDAELVVHSPTVLYVTGSDSSWSAFKNFGKVRVAADAARGGINPTHLPDLGLSVVVPRQVKSSRAPYVEVSLGDFEGSLYAPQAFVELGPSDREEAGCDNCMYGQKGTKRRLGFVVGDSIFVDGVDLDFNHANSQAQSIKRNFTITSWTLSNP